MVFSGASFVQNETEVAFALTLALSLSNASANPGPQSGGAAFQLAGSLGM